MNCRSCAQALSNVFLDLGFAPPSNAYLSSVALKTPEKYFPLKLYLCANCWLVQTEDYSQADELFDADYAYFSSTSISWLEHAAHYSQQMVQRLGLNRDSLVVEVASNDGYLLKNFLAVGIPCLGIEPTASTAAVAEALGIPVVREFFGEKMAIRLVAVRGKADLIAGNNVYAHVPNINDFTRGLAVALKDQGTITLEFPHLLRLMEMTQFDTVYHEHFSYLSLHTVKRTFAMAGLRIFDVEELATHGGSLRIFGCHIRDGRAETAAVARVLEAEDGFGLRNVATYAGFQQRADRIKDDFVSFLIAAKREGKRVAAYGAAAKGNTLMNYAGIRPDLLPYVCDAALAKQGKYMPGSHIPILAPEILAQRKPDYVVILPWNIRAEVMSLFAGVREWGGRFVWAVPSLEIL